MRPATESSEFRQDLVSVLPKLRRFALTLTHTGADAEELVQEACERAMARGHLWNGEGRLESWIYAMTRTLWVDEISKRKARPGTGAPTARDDKPLSANHLHTMILSMPDGLASVFLLINVEGHSYRETAEILKIPANTVMSRLSAARLRLATLMAETTERRA